jgi:hypothetical protein
MGGYSENMKLEVRASVLFMVAVLMVAMVMTIGCAATTTKTKNTQPILPTYPVAFEEPAFVYDPVSNDKILFEGFIVQNEKEKPELRIRATYSRYYSQSKYIKEPYTIADVVLLQNTGKGLEKWRGLTWKRGEDLGKSRVSFNLYKPYNVNGKYYVDFAAKHYPSVNKDFFGEEPLCCRSLLNKDDIPNNLRLALGMEIKETTSQKIVGAIGALSMIAAPVAILVAAPLQYGAQAAAGIAGQAAVSGAAQMALAKVASADLSGKDGKAVLSPPEQQNVAILPECFDLDKLKSIKN